MAESRPWQYTVSSCGQTMMQGSQSPFSIMLSTIFLPFMTISP